LEGDLDEFLPRAFRLQADDPLADEAQVEEPLVARHGGGEVGPHHCLVLQVGVTGQEQAVVQDDGTVPLQQVQQEDVLVGGFQHQQAVPGVLRLDGRLLGDRPSQGLAEKIPHPFDAGGGVDVAHHPLHGPGLEGDVCLAEVTDHLPPADMHGTAEIGRLGIARGDAEVPLVLDHPEGAQLG